MGHAEHKHNAPETVKCVVITVSDTRDVDKDTSGKLIKEKLSEMNHDIIGYEIVKDDKEEILQALGKYDAQVFIFNGGTGISERDVTPDCIKDVLDKELPGFGELFRSLSYEEIGSAAMLSRAVAGIYDEKVIFSIPGSTGAVKTAMEELILPELGHVVYEVNK
ncbi:MAG: MogA/MoaB family molybdenum cofactor biosynthesis protein [Thermoplasmatota archaeon]